MTVSERFTQENINPVVHAGKVKFPNQVDSPDVSKEKRTRFGLSVQSYDYKTDEPYPTQIGFTDPVHSDSVDSSSLNDISNSEHSSRYKRHVFNSFDFPSIEEYPEEMEEDEATQADNFVNNLSFDSTTNNYTANNVNSDYGHSSASNASSIQHQHHHSDAVKRGTFSRSLSNADVPSDDNGKSVDNTSLRSSDTQLHQTSMEHHGDSRRRGGKSSSGIKHSNSGTSDKSGNSSDRGERSDRERERGERSSNLGKKSSSTSQLSATGKILGRSTTPRVLLKSLIQFSNLTRRSSLASLDSIKL
ncbi:uncharacterized protein LOC113470341 [Diaphorina citri]|uniref:Uncharacterized protein LOC113470341 n=1 Tax=Diaphorina citri TaxID=121845 RepID=A0A3Q0J7R2_DIACI|nr:uncharacterized protein LOC113470341 [Diaphorina citri]